MAGVKAPMALPTVCTPADVALRRAQARTRGQPPAPVNMPMKSASARANSSRATLVDRSAAMGSKKAAFRVVGAACGVVQFVAGERKLGNRSGHRGFEQEGGARPHLACDAAADAAEEALCVGNHLAVGAGQARGGCGGARAELFLSAIPLSTFGACSQPRALVKQGHRAAGWFRRGSGAHLPARRQRRRPPRAAPWRRGPCWGCCQRTAGPRRRGAPPARQPQPPPLPPAARRLARARASQAQSFGTAGRGCEWAAARPAGNQHAGLLLVGRHARCRCARMCDRRGGAPHWAGMRSRPKPPRHAHPHVLLLLLRRHVLQPVPALVALRPARAAAAPRRRRPHVGRGRHEAEGKLAGGGVEVVAQQLARLGLEAAHERGVRGAQRGVEGLRGRPGPEVRAGLGGEGGRGASCYLRTHTYRPSAPCRAAAAHAPRRCAPSAPHPRPRSAA